MTPQEIKENNILLAEFLGAELEETESNLFVYCLEMPSHTDLSGYKKEFYEPNELQFHFNWNWLMQVVKEVIRKANQKFSDEDLDIYLQNSLATADISDVYICCVECVKWYNQNKGGN